MNSIGIMFVDANPNKLTPEEIEHLEWVRSRLEFVHKENPNFDYMLKFAEIIKKLKVKSK